MGKLLRITVIAILFAFCFSLVSCQSVLTHSLGEKEQKLYQEGYDPYHASSCGPRAISGVLKGFGKEEKPKDISKEMLKDNSIVWHALRNIGALFHYKSLAITPPRQMTAILDKRGYKLISISGSQEALKLFLESHSSSDGLVLVWKKGSAVDAHWLSLKKRASIILRHYGKDTYIYAVYLVAKKVNP